MANIIDTLTVVLDWDPSKYKKGQEEADSSVTKSRQGYERHAKLFEQASMQLERSIRGLSEAFLTLIGAMGLIDLGKTIIQTASMEAELDALANNMNVSVTALGKWKGAAINSMGSFDELSGSMQKTFQTLEQWKVSGAQAGPLLQIFGQGMPGQQRLGVDTNGDILQTYTSLFDKLKQLSDSGKEGHNRAVFYLHQIGITNNRLIDDILKLGGKYLEVRSKGTPPITKADIEAARELSSGWNRLINDIEALKRAITTAVEGPFKMLLDWMDKIVQKIRDAIMSPTPTLTPEEAIKQGRAGVGTRWPTPFGHGPESWEKFKKRLDEHPGMPTPSHSSTTPAPLFGPGGFLPGGQDFTNAWKYITGKGSLGGSALTPPPGATPPSAPTPTPNISGYTSPLDVPADKSMVPLDNMDNMFNLSGPRLGHESMLSLPNRVAQASAGASVLSSKSNNTQIGNISINTAAAVQSDAMNINRAPGDFTESLLGGAFGLHANMSLV